MALTWAMATRCPALGHNAVVLLRELVQTSEAVAATSGRTAKITEIAGLLRRAGPGEVPVVVAFLSGELRQRQIGVGYASLGELLRLEPSGQPPTGPWARVAPEQAQAAGAPVTGDPLGIAIKDGQLLSESMPHRVALGITRDGNAFFDTLVSVGSPRTSKQGTARRWVPTVPTRAAIPSGMAGKAFPAADE